MDSPNIIVYDAATPMFESIPLYIVQVRGCQEGLSMESKAHQAVRRKG